jgi:hypothetical protein
MKTTKYALAVTLGVIALLAPRAVRADTIYTYTGSTFNSSLDSINGSITVSGSLIPNQSYNAGGTLLVAFDFFISGPGTPSFTNTNGAAIREFSFTTDANGNINFWDIAICSGPCGDPSDPLSRLRPPAIAMCNTLSVPPGVFIGSDVCDTIGSPTTRDSYEASILVSYSSDTAGTWSSPTPVSPAPEPSSALLLATGILGVMVMQVQRRKRVAWSRRSP